MNEIRIVASRLSPSICLLSALLLTSCAVDYGQEEITDDEPAASESSHELSVPISNPSFESDKADWGDPSLFEISTSDTHTGTKSAKITSSTGRFQQAVTVAPNTSYSLAAWILGKGTIGVKSGSTVLGSQSASTSAWTQTTVSFNSGSATSVLLYGAYSGGTGRFDDFTLNDGASPPPPPPPPPGGSYPADLLNLTNWKLTLPVDTAHAGSPDEIKQPELDTFVDSTYFHLNAAGDAVVFRAHAGGATTSGSGYPRSELREMKDSGVNNASWSSSSGTHTLYIDQKITHLPSVKPHLVVGQIHDSSDDVIVFRLEGQKLFIDLNGTDGPTLTSSYVLGTRFNVKFEVSNNAVKCYYNGALKYTYPKAFSGAYFKAGAYTQSSCQGDKQVPGESCSAYGEVEIYDVQVQHL